MQLKRHYEQSPGRVPVHNVRRSDGTLPVPSMAEGECLNPRPLSHIELQHTGASENQNFSDTMVEEAMRYGLMSFDPAGTLLFHVKPETLRYKVLRVPGSYCLICGENLNDNTRNDGAISRAHMAAKHPGVSSPDAANPAGYERIHHYECVLDADQHDKFAFAQWDAKRKGRA